MPEGPETRRNADMIGAVLEHKLLVDVDIGLPTLQPHLNDLVGQKGSSSIQLGQSSTH